MRITKLSSRELHKKVWKKAGGRCAHRVNITHGQKTLDHVIPKSAGGSSTIDNFMPLCRRCNMAKGSRRVDPWQYYKFAKEEALLEYEQYAGRFYAMRRRLSDNSRAYSRKL